MLLCGVDKKLLDYVDAKREFNHLKEFQNSCKHAPLRSASLRAIAGNAQNFCSKFRVIMLLCGVDKKLLDYVDENLTI